MTAKRKKLQKVWTQKESNQRPFVQLMRMLPIDCAGAIGIAASTALFMERLDPD